MKKPQPLVFGVLFTLVVLWYLNQEWSSTKHRDTFIPAHQGQVFQVNKSSHQIHESLQEVAEARAALEARRRESEKELERERAKLEKEWEKLEEERNRLENDKEAFGAGVRMGLYKRKQSPREEQAQKEREERRKYMDGLAPAQSGQFEGLNSTEVHTHYPGISLRPDYRLRQFVESDSSQFPQMPRPPQSLSDLDDIEAEERFYHLVTRLHVECLEVVRQGSQGDGGYQSCMSAPYLPSSPCLVYSFGINNDFTFDDAMANRYKCNVRSFDPSMTIGDHKHSQLVWFYQLGLGPRNTVTAKSWKLETFGSILAKGNHLQSVIDVLKIDIDYNEWDCLLSMFKEGSLNRVKQLIIEIHTPELYLIGRKSTREDFSSMYNTLLELEQRGFRRFSVSSNPHGDYLSVRSGIHRTCCYELSYINIHFLKS